MGIRLCRTVQAKELMLMTRQLAAMLDAGLPILKALTVLYEGIRNKRLQEAVMDVRDDIERGSTLYQALAKHPEIFSPIYIHMVQAGEVGGVLDIVLERLADHIAREREVLAKLKAASIYPGFILIIAGIVAVFILTYVMPVFVDMFAAADIALPAPTRMLIRISQFFQLNWQYLPGLLILFMVSAHRLHKLPGGRYFLDRMALRMPLVGRLNGQIIQTRFARTMGILIQSGIPVLQALEVMEGVAGNVCISGAIHKARVNIAEGDSIAFPLQASGVFDPIVVQMIAVGEESGTVDEMLLKISEYFDKEFVYSVEQAAAMAEPLLIMLAALLIGGMVIATLLPVFEVSRTVL